MEREHSAIPLPPASSPDPTQMQMMPQTPQTKSLAAQSGGVVLSETQLGNMALRAKQQRCKAEQDRQLLQVCARRQARTMPDGAPAQSAARRGDGQPWLLRGVARMHAA